ncbi:hypothetical protein GA0115240_14561 [Streptomyces sp. DvalAA-14]|uniref:hypothetical protein n=1 Tax=unclassified Streptomyces TaxID=2593676 RepID=UPI00081AF6C0|nr:MULTISPECIES: hypothetical protein [unclassified Streptomyces]SCE23773.1 hypothetical protein GA0115240_14561 [Streptomyces sp. DvalAA-14]
MSDQHPHDQPTEASVRPAGVPSVRDVLAACAAARTLSTPPDTSEPAPRRQPNRDAA